MPNAKFCRPLLHLMADGYVIGATGSPQCGLIDKSQSPQAQNDGEIQLQVGELGQG